jgi:hypothetical protein
VKLARRAHAQFARIQMSSATREARVREPTNGGRIELKEEERDGEKYQTEMAKNFHKIYVIACAERAYDQ